jgi:ribosome-associated toxin RatA of RatAB toxin-antitoxin module
MNVTTTAIEIAAEPATIFGFASTTERWPEYLPHYRSVRILEDRGATRVVEMAAWRGRIPIRWVAEQRNDPMRPHIAFLHLRGWTRGMEVEWRFLPISGGTRVEIEHRLRFRFPIASEWLGRHVVSDFFIDYVAQRTLARMKVLAEAAC